MSKWIFLVADLLLLVGCAWTLQQFLNAKSPYAGLVAIVAILGWAYGAWICIMPWLQEYRAETKHLENETLNDAISQIQRLEEISSRVQTATGSWQSAQDAANRTVLAAREVEEKIRSNTKEFIDFSERVTADERNHLRLEVEKLRRAEGEWLHSVARLLDHAFALVQAAHRSGKPQLITQMINFQNACRESVRRVGLAAFEPLPGEPFDERGHQLEDANSVPSPGATINEVLATGFTYQGQLLRRALVRVATAQPDPQTAPAAIEETSAAPLIEPTQEVSPPEPESTPAPDVEPHPSAAAEAPGEMPPETNVEPAVENQSAPPWDEKAPAENSAPAPEIQDDAEPPKPPRRRRTDPQTSLPL